MADSDNLHWQRLEDLFHGALEQPAHHRQAWLERQAGDSPQLVQEVLELLGAHSEDHSRLNQAVADAAHTLSTSKRPDSGHRLGPYRILRCLGQGGMGAVYLAERDDQEYHQQVAIKVIGGFPGDQALESLRRERQILAELSHPNIARLLDGGSTEDGQPYLVMEYIDGLHILQWCRENDVDRARRIRLMLKICEAVHFAHQHLIVHRDIKPGNVLITTDGQPMLLDFGIAKLVSEPDQELTQSACFYTPGYASPEQLSGERVTTAADIYSLGRLLLSLLGVSVARTGARDEHGVRRTDWQRELPRDLAAIIDQATRAEPTERYATASALRADLARYLDNRPVKAVRRRWGYRLGKFIRRNRLAMTVAALGVVISVGLLIRLANEYERARAAESMARLEAERAEQSSSFLLSLLGSIEPEYADGADTVLMRRVLETAAERAPLELAAQPLILSDIEYAIGHAYVALGLHDEADQHLALASGLARDATDQTRHLKPQIQQARLDALRGNYTAGIERIDRVLEQSRHRGMADLLHLDAMLQKVELLILSARYDTAEGLVTELIEATNNASDTFLINLHLESLRSLAQIHTYSQRFDAGIAMYRQVQDAASQWDHPAAKRHLASALNDHGMTLLQQQMPTEAEPLLRQSLALQQERLGDEHPRLIPALANLAGCLRHQHRLDEAEPFMQRALAIAMQSYGPDQPPTLIVKSNFGNLRRVQGQALAAVELQRPTVALLDSVFQPEHPAQGVFRVGLGKSELAAGNLHAAIEVLEEAVIRLTDIFGPEHYRTIDAQETLDEARRQLDYHD